VVASELQIVIAFQFAFQHFEDIKKVMIVDLDAHQGNGHARDFMNDDRVYIMDVFNRNIYPQDGYAKAGINRLTCLLEILETLIHIFHEISNAQFVWIAGEKVLSFSTI